MKPMIYRAQSEQAFAIGVYAALETHVQKLTSLPNIILPTGTTPAPFYAYMRKTGFRPFRYLQLDEYVGLPQDDPILFSNWLDRDVLGPLNISQRMVFNSAAKPSEEIARIRAWHAANRTIDVAVIGIGENGHVGFNEPGCKFRQGAHLETLSQSTWEQNCAYRKRDVPRQVMTLGIADLKRANHTILIARGANKADILYRAFHEAVTPDVPASYLQRQRNVTIIADAAALSRMPA